MTNRKRAAFVGAMLTVWLAVSLAVAGQFHVEVVSKGFQHDFWMQVKRGCDAAGEEFGATVNFVGPANESAFEEQNHLFAEAIAGKPSAVCIASLSPESSIPLVFEAADAGIPVIAFDSAIGPEAGGDVQSFVATNNRDAGAAAAQEMFDRLIDKEAFASLPARIGVLAQDTISQSNGDRTFGFIERMVQLCGAADTSVEGHLLYERPLPGAKVVIHVGIPAEAADEAMDEVVRSMFERANLVGVYASNEFAAKSIIRVNESFDLLGPGKVVGIGFDSGAAQIEAVRDRVLHGSITQNPYMIGYLCVKTAIEAARGLPVGDIDVPFHFYTADNMDEPDIAACLYQ